MHLHSKNSAYSNIKLSPFKKLFLPILRIRHFYASLILTPEDYRSRFNHEFSLTPALYYNMKTLEEKAEQKILQNFTNSHFFNDFIQLYILALYFYEDINSLIT